MDHPAETSSAQGNWKSSIILILVAVVIFGPLALGVAALYLLVTNAALKLRRPGDEQRH